MGREPRLSPSRLHDSRDNPESGGEVPPICGRARERARGPHRHRRALDRSDRLRTATCECPCRAVHPPVIALSTCGRGRVPRRLQYGAGRARRSDCRSCWHPSAPISPYMHDDAQRSAWAVSSMRRRWMSPRSGPLHARSSTSLRTEQPRSRLNARSWHCQTSEQPRPSSNALGIQAGWQTVAGHSCRSAREEPAEPSSAKGRRMPSISARSLRPGYSSRLPPRRRSPVGVRSAARNPARRRFRGRSDAIASAIRIDGLGGLGGERA